MSEVLYPYVENGSYIFKAFTGLSFADRALVIVEPGSEFWALHIIRKDNVLRMFDDFSWQHWRRQEGINHSINYMGNYDRDVARPVTAEEVYKNVGLGSRPCEERDTPSVAAGYISNLAWDWVHSRRDAPGIDEAEAQSRIERLFSEHLGVDYSDLIAAGGELSRDRERFNGAKPLREIALRPLPEIPEGYIKPALIYG